MFQAATLEKVIALARDIGGQWPALLCQQVTKCGVMFLHDLIEQRLLRPVPDIRWPGRLPPSLVSGHSGILSRYDIEV